MYIPPRLALLLPLLCLNLQAMPGDSVSVEQASTYVYKKTGQADLSMTVFTPGKEKAHGGAVMLFFPGGWKTGKIATLFPQVEILLENGWVCLMPDYRVKRRHQTSPVDAVEDALDAYAFALENHAKLHFDPDRLVVGGASSGGHLAACVALLEKDATNNIIERTKDVPTAAVLYNPPLDLPSVAGKLIKDLTLEQMETISPLQRLHKKLPPTLIMHGNADYIVKPIHAQSFHGAAQKLGLQTKLVLYPGKHHGFFNPNKDPEGFTDSSRELVKFLSPFSAPAD